MTDTPSSMRVLLVDDDVDVLGAIARFLRVNHIDVMVAESGQSALARIDESEVNAIVTDLRMSGTNGLEFAVLAREKLPLVPLIFFSGFAQVPDVVAAMKLGAVEFLEKPVEPDELLQVLRKMHSSHYGHVLNPRFAFEDSTQGYSLRMRVLAYEKHVIESCLIQHRGHIASVLETLQINRRTLNDKMSKLGIKREDLLDKYPQGLPPALTETQESKT